MTNRFYLTVIAAVLVCFQVDAKEVYRHDSSKANVPMLAVKGTNVVDVGTVHNYAVTNVMFKVTNTGAAPVKIERLVPLCTCVTATASAKEVAPGGEITVTLRLDPIKEHGDMERSIWVLGSDTDTPHLKLTLTGKAVPLFSGLPKHAVAIRIPETGVESVKKFNLAASVPGVRLGKPEVKPLEGIKVGVEMTEKTGSTAAYELKAAAVAAAPGNYEVEILLPVQGLSGVEPIAIKLAISAGEIMTAFPRAVELGLTGEAQSARLVLRGKGLKLDPGAVTWTPKKEGVVVEVTPGRGESELLVKIDFAPEAADALYREKNAALVFRHPGIGAASVPVKVEIEAGRNEGPRGRRRSREDLRNFKFNRRTPNFKL